MSRILTALILTLGLTFCAASSTPAALLGISLKLGGGLIPDGKRAGGIVQADIGPISPFAEFFKKGDLTTVNAGVNFLLRLPTPMVSPYGGFGGGVSRTSVNGISDSQIMLDFLAGADLKTGGPVSFFGQGKYIYTFGSFPAVKELAFQAGIRFYLGL